jgi:hypothetical protein
VVLGFAGAAVEQKDLLMGDFTSLEKCGDGLGFRTKVDTFASFDSILIIGKSW